MGGVIIPHRRERPKADIVSATTRACGILDAMKTRCLIGYALGVGLLGGGVALAQRESAIYVAHQNAIYNVRLTGTELVAPDVQLRHSSKEIRGQLGGATTAIAFKGSDAGGTIGAGAVNLKIRVEGTTVKAQGGIAGRVVELTYSPAELSVYVKDCTWRLRSTEPNAYVGRRSCDPPFYRDTEVKLPERFLQLSPAEQATILVLVLSLS